MTGLHTGHCFIRGNSKQNLRAGDVTFAEVLQRFGYTCGAFGKWGLGHENSGGMPTLQGFDDFYGYFDQTHAHNYFPTFLMRGTRRELLTNVVPNEGKEGSGVATERNQYSHDLIFAEALRFLDENHEKPFLLYLPFTIPHANNEAGRQGLEITDVGRFADEDWPEPEKAFAAMVSRLDTDVGTLLDKLEQLELTGNTYVFFTSDIGPHKDGGHDPEFFDSNGPFQGIKRDLTEGGIRVPFLARCPGRIEAGSVSHHWGYLGDLFATVCDLSGAPQPLRLDSVSIAPTLLGRSEDQVTQPYLYWEFYERGFSQAVRHGEWKAIRNGPRGDVKLYNLVDDPGETTDLAKDQSRVARQMAGLMDEAHVPSPEWPVNKAARRKTSE
jgi:arylsulfatase A-like enzyme